MREESAAGRSGLKVYWCPLTAKQAIGYGRVSVKLAHALALAGVHVLTAFEWDWDYIVVPATPFAGLHNRGGALRPDLVFHTMFDSDFLPLHWAHLLNRVGAVWVPSEWCRQVFEDSGVNRPMFVAGYGVDAEQFPFSDRSSLADEPVTFLHTAAGMWDRKGTYQVLKAWHKLQLPDARLIVKFTTGHFNNLTIKDMDNVVTIKEDLDDAAWAALMHSCDALVYPSAGEGFGLMPLEFAATGGLSIATDYSGMTEYLHDVPMLGIDVARMVPAELYNNIYFNEARWAEPSLDDLCDKMRWVYDHREAAWETGRQAAARVAEAWTWEHAGHKARAGLESL